MKRKIQIFDILIIIGLLLITLVSFYPFVFTIAGSFNNGIDYQYGGVWIFPREITLANYQAVLGDPKLYILFFHVVEILFEFPAFEQFTDGQSPRLSFKLLFAEKIMRYVF